MKNFEVPDKKTTYQLAATELCQNHIGLISISFIQGLPRTNRDPIKCHADGFAEGVAFAMQIIAEGKFNMRIVERDCTICGKPSSQCDGGFFEMTTRQ